MNHTNNTEKNPFGLAEGDIILAPYRGFHKLMKINLDKQGNLIGIYNQLFTEDGKPVNMYRPTEADLRECSPAIIKLAELKKRIDQLQNVYEILITEKNKNG